MKEGEVPGESKDLASKVLETGLLPDLGRTLTMISGGGDSVALLSLLTGMLGSGKVLALHVNYGLRGADADADEALCRDLCERLSVELVVERAQLDANVAGNLHARARELRYSLAHDLAAREGCSAIAVAHTADDQAETILYRLLASPGRRALLGMPRRRGLIIRPLLCVRRRELRDWCRTHDLPWREDMSNADPKFARARVRHLLADAEAVHPAAVANVLRSADDLRAESAALDEIVSQLLAGAIDDDGALTVAALESVPPALAALALRSYVEDAAGAGVSAAGSALADALRLAAAGGSHALQVAGAELTIEYGKLRVASGAARAVPPAAQLPVPGTVAFGHWTITAGEPAANDAVTATVRADAAAAGLLVRARDDGDRMRPAGLGGSKSLQDLFVDRKIPRTQRATHPVVCAGEEIIWIPGVAIGEGHSVAEGQGTLLTATP